MAKWYNYRSLFLIILLATALRIYPIAWGTPFYSQDNWDFHPDEPKITYSIYNFPENVWKDSDYRYPHLIHNLGGLLWGTLRPVISVLDRTAGAESDHTSYPYSLIFARLITLITGVLSVIFTFKLGSHIFGRRAGILAAALLNFPTYHLINSSVCTTDVPSSLALTGTLYFFLKTYEKEHIKWFHAVPLGILTGLSIATKYTLAILLPSFFILVIYCILNKKIKITDSIFFTVTGVAIAIITFLIANPGIFFLKKQFIDSIYYEYSTKSKPFQFNYLLSDNIINGFSLPLLILFVLGLAISILKKNCIGTICLFVTLVLYFYKMAPSFAPRYGIAILPIVCIFSGFFIDQILIFGQNLKFINPTIILIIAIFIASSFNYVFRRYEGDSRYRFENYVKDTIPAGSEVGLSSVGTYRRRAHSWSLPKLSNTDYKILDALTYPEWMILSSNYYPYVEKALKNPNLLWDTGFWGGRSIPRRDALNFYRDILLDDKRQYKYELIKTIEPTYLNIEFKGDKYYIYRRTDSKNRPKGNFGPTVFNLQAQG